MRPLRISLRGLRSYRAECTIDFTAKSLVAIVGPTGSGKSSILEGITYALYNATTWTAGEPKLLIADGVQTMSVVLDFEAAGKVWQIHRACSKTNYPPSVHKLSCLSEPGLPELDGEEAVNREVQRLIGLSHRAFLAAVILPQGRFQTLLTARPNDRIAILEGIFRLTELRQVRSHAEELRNRVNPTLTHMVGRRAGLLDDPASEAAAQEAELAKAIEREKALLALQEQVKRTADAQREASVEVKRLRDPIARLKAIGSGAGKLLTELVPLAAKVDGEVLIAQTELTKLHNEERAEIALLEVAASAGQDFEHLTEVAATLRGLKAELTRIGSETVAVASDERAVAREGMALDRDSAGIAELQRSWDAAGKLADDAAAAAAAHSELGTETRAQLSSTRLAEKQAAEARRQETEERSKLPALHKTATRNADLVKTADSRLKAARQALRELEREHAAAHAAEGLEAGDICPVCGGVLASGFTPPDAGELKPARKAVEAAEIELANQRDFTTTAALAVRSCMVNIQNLESRRTILEKEASDHLATLVALIPGADLKRPDHELLGPVEAAGVALTADALARRAATDEARTAWERADAALKPRRDALRQSQTKLATRMSALSSDSAACERAIAALPTFARPKAPRTDAVEKPLEEVNRRLSLARRAKDQREDLLRRSAAARSFVAELLARRSQQVEGPRRKAAELLAQLLPRVNDCLEQLGEVVFLEAAEGASLEEYAAWATDLEACAEHVARELEQRARGIELEATAQSAKLAKTLEKTGFASSAAVQAEVAGAQRLIGQIAAALESARKQVPLVADLDRRIELGTELLESAQELVRLLADGQFVRHVIERRQRNLLAVASEILGSVTAQRYGFSEDFEIVDQLSGQPRPTRTLSGGETFLASLALALALVEMAGRSGRQIDALFLDEGFGALDPSALDEALGALERKADQGRLVAVVSHVREVADRIESVLEVAKHPGGSRADWRLPRDREAMAEEALYVAGLHDQRDDRRRRSEETPHLAGEGATSSRGSRL